MWLLYRLDKRNTGQHGEAIDLIKSIKNDITEVKQIQVWTDLKFDRHIEQDHDAINNWLLQYAKTAVRKPGG